MLAPNDELAVAMLTALVKMHATSHPTLQAVVLLYEALRQIPEGVKCDFGCNGDRMCIPSRWEQEGWAWQAENCAHCPVFQRHAVTKVG